MTTKRTSPIGRTVSRVFLVAVIIVFGGCPGKEASGDPYHLVEAFPGLTFEQPLWIGHAGDGSGRLYVVERAGRISVFDSDSAAATLSVFLDISERVNTGYLEEGLLALAFHPHFASNGVFFAYYSADTPQRGILSRFHVDSKDGHSADPQSEEIILEVEEPYVNHNGSTIVFGPDGYLYMSLGDGGSAGDPHGNGQNLGTLLGSILRIDVDHPGDDIPYSTPADNPFVERDNARGEIWAYGLRNVWRMSFDPNTGVLWAADVGQNQWEEIDLIVKGGNYGWNIREGTHDYAGGTSESPLIDPIYEYPHRANSGQQFGGSITGGFVYHGPRLKELAGAYVYADFITGTIWLLRYADGAVIENKTLVRQERNISSFGEGPDGTLFVCAFDGHIYLLEEN